MARIENRRRRKFIWLCLVVAVTLTLGWFFVSSVTRHASTLDSAGQPQASGGLVSGRPETATSARPDGRRDADRPVASQRTARRLSAERVLNYGGGAAEVGMIRVTEMAPIGPESFALAGNGNVLVADLVNHRIQVYAADGAHLRTVDLPGVNPNDLMTDGQGRLYVYNQASQVLLQYDASGTPQGTLNLTPTDINTRGYFHLAGDSVYFADAAARDLLVATVKDGILTPAERSADRATDGIHAESGRVYSVAVAKGEALRLQVRDAVAESVPRLLEVASPDILSACYVGEDQAGRFYVQIERLVGGRVSLEVLTFSRVGEQLSAMRLPENDYALWTAKLVDVAADGTIVQFLPQKSQARLNRFSE